MQGVRNNFVTIVLPRRFLETCTLKQLLDLTQLLLIRFAGAPAAHTSLSKQSVGRIAAAVERLVRSACRLPVCAA
jgi:hypothetical protein